MYDKNLLYVVQSVMASLGSDGVNSIYDTTESEDVAVIARDVFYDMITWDTWPSTMKLITLESASNSEAPTVVRMKDNCRFIEYATYLVEEHGNTYFRELCYLEPRVFLEKTNLYLQDEHVKSEGYGIVNTFVPVKTDKEPQYYTSFDNEHIIMDSVNLEVESNIQSSKLRVYACVIPDFDIDDKYVLPIPTQLMNLYMSELKNAAAYYINQQENPLEQKKSLRHLVNLRNNSDRMVNEQEENYPTGQYGRGYRHPNLSKLGRR